MQLAKALGASMVIGTTTSASKVDAVLAAGADHVVDTSNIALSDAVQSITEDAGVDVVLDHVGGALTAELLLATRPLGTIVNIGRLGGSAATIDLDTLEFRRLHVFGATFSIRTAEERGEVESGDRQDRRRDAARLARLERTRPRDSSMTSAVPACLHSDPLERGQTVFSVVAES